MHASSASSATTGLRAAENLTTALADGFGQADAIRDQGEDVARRIVRAESRYRDMGDAMMVYAPQLEAAQTRSIDARRWTRARPTS